MDKWIKMPSFTKLRQVVLATSILPSLHPMPIFSFSILVFSSLTQHAELRSAGGWKWDTLQLLLRLVRFHVHGDQLILAGEHMHCISTLGDDIWCTGAAQTYQAIYSKRWWSFLPWYRRFRHQSLFNRSTIQPVDHLLATRIFHHTPHISFTSSVTRSKVTKSDRWELSGKGYGNLCRAGCFTSPPFSRIRLPAFDPRLKSMLIIKS